MKSEHRHELAENELSKILGRWMQKFDEQSNKMLIGIVGVALIVAVLIFLVRSWANERSSGWTDLAASTTPEQFETVAETYAGTPVADWARLRAANGFLQEGIQLSLTNRSASTERLEQAKRAFESLTGPRTNPAIREQALNGLAVTLESLSDGNTEPAIAAYQKLIDEFPQSRFRRAAEERIAALKTGRVQEFYAWFHAQNPQPLDRPLPQDQSRSSGGSLESLLPELGTGLSGSGGSTPFDSTPLNVPLSGDAPTSQQADPDPFADSNADEGGQSSAASPDAVNQDSLSPDSSRPQPESAPSDGKPE